MPFIFQFIIYLVIGAFAGLFGGLLGIGGGSITVPALLLLFSFLDFPEEHLMQIAVATSLAAMVINTLSAMYFHHLKKAVSWNIVRGISPGIFVGSFIGAFVANMIPSRFLENIFGFFACSVALYLAKPIKVTLDPHKKPKITGFLLTTIGCLVSFIANILGIGGGIFMVPILTHLRFSSQSAIGTSSALSFLISFYGALGYIIDGASAETIKSCLGYIYIPAFLVVGISSFFGASYGAKLAHRLKVSTLRKVFACALMVVGIIMILS